MGTLWLMLIGLIGRSLAQPVGSQWALAWWLAVVRRCWRCLRLASSLRSYRNVARSGKGLAFYDYYILRLGVVRRPGRI